MRVPTAVHAYNGIIKLFETQHNHFLEKHSGFFDSGFIFRFHELFQGALKDMDKIHPQSDFKILPLR